MSISKLRNSTAIDQALTMTAVDEALKLSIAPLDQVQQNKSTQDASPNRGTTADRVSLYLRGISENSTDEIDALISDLRGLREKLVADGIRIEQDLVDFDTLNQSVIRLTEVVSQSVAQVKASQSR